MKIVVRKTLILILTIFLMPLISHGFNLDETVDDDIRKNYNDSKLINDTGVKAVEKNIKNKSLNQQQSDDLPPLPGITKYPASNKPSDVKSTNEIKPIVKYRPYNGGNIKVHKGTIFDVVNNSAITDWQRVGTSVKFSVKTPIQTNKYIIPAWTAFNGEIIDVHQPQLSCNGGLVAIRVYSMIYKGQLIPINGYIVKANDKRVFFNDIKGERRYLKTVWKKGGWGRALFNRMLSLTVNLGGDGSTLVLAPFPFLYGTLCVGLNTIVSPITAFFQKGGHVSIPAGSKFRIKLIEDIYID